MSNPAHHTITKETHSNLPKTSPIISHLPSDLLSLIFQYTYPTPLFDGRYHCRPNNTRFLQSLSLVSRHWYRTLMTTPELWTYICIPMEEGTNTSTYAAALASFFEKTTHRALSLSLDFSALSHFEDDTTLLHSSVDDVILKNLERIENLQLVKPPPAWFSHLRLLSRVDHLSLYLIQEGEAPLISLDHIPSLSKFTFVNGDIRVSMTSPCLVTSLTLIGVPLNTCFHIIANCPKLTTLYLEDYDGSGEQRLDGNPPIEAFEPRPLKHLTWKIFSTTNFVTPWQAALLYHLTTTSLQTLTWHQPPSWTLSETPHGRWLGIAISHFFTRLSSSLRCVEFVDDNESMWGRESAFVECLGEGCGVEVIGFEGCNVPFVMAVLGKLVVPNRFPKVCRIRVGRIVWSSPRQLELDRRFGKMLGEQFLKIVKGRGGIALYLEDDSVYREEDGSNCDWLDCIKPELVELKKSCHQFDIFIASKAVGWL